MLLWENVQRLDMSAIMVWDIVMIVIIGTGTTHSGFCASCYASFLEMPWSWMMLSC